MTIDEAINTLDDIGIRAWGDDVQYEADACQLGLEALKRVKDSREAGGQLQGWLLPGETE